MSLHLIIVAWEYPGVNSSKGSALARRVGQVARGFADKGWNVSIIHKDQISENIPFGDFVMEYTEAGNAIKRYPVQGPNIDQYGFSSKSALLRKISTVWYSYFYGDRSHNWAKTALKIFKSKNLIQKPDLIIGFFTPRGPLWLANYISRKYNVPWFADLQDTFDEGSSNSLKFFVTRWTKRALKSAAKIVHVSPEWAMRDSHILNLPITYLRHAVPQLPAGSINKVKENNNTFDILYAGSLDKRNQPPGLFIKAVSEIILNNLEKKITLKIAGTESVYNEFKRFTSNTDFISWLGWLSYDQLQEQLLKSDCLLIIPWTSDTRQVIPSKLYEYVSFNKPILLAGEDTGSISILLKEWGHPNVLCDSKDKIIKSITNGINSDFSLMVQPSQCKFKPMNEKELVENYLKFYNELI